MSGSTPAPTNLTRKRSDAESPFWLLSLIFHGVLIAVVLFVAPVREIVFKKKKVTEPEVITRGDELEEVIEMIRDRTAEKLRVRLALLEQGQERMYTNFDTMNQHFQPFAEQQRATARTRLEKYTATTLEHQQKLTELLLATQDGGDARAAVEYSHENMSRILTAQEEIRRGIQLLELGDELLTKQKECEDAQFEAGNFMRWLEGDLSSIDQNEQKLAKLKLRNDELSEKLPGLDEAVKAARAEHDAAKQKVSDLQDSLKEVRKEKDKEKTKEVTKNIEKQRREVLSLARRIPKAESAVRNVKNELNKVNAEQKRANDSKAKAIAKRDEHLRVGINIQRGTYLKQQEIVTAITEEPAPAKTETTDE